MATSEELVTVYLGWLIDAERAQSALEGHRLRTALLGEHVSALYGLAEVRVVVRACDAEAARDVLEGSGLLRPR